MARYRRGVAGRSRMRRRKASRRFRKGGVKAKRYRKRRHFERKICNVALKQNYHYLGATPAPGYNSPIKYVWQTSNAGAWQIQANGFRFVRVAAATTVDIGSWAQSFCLRDIEHVATWQRIYDQYRIRGVKLTFMPYQTIAASSTATKAGSTAGTGRALAVLLHYRTDEDSITDFGINTETVLENFLHAPDIKHRRLTPGRPFSIYLRPCPCNMVYDDNTTGTAYGLMKRTSWLDTQNDLIPYYGLKAACEVDGGDTNDGMNVRVMATYYVQFRERYRNDTQELTLESSGYGLSTTAETEDADTEHIPPGGVPPPPPGP